MNWYKYLPTVHAKSMVKHGCIKLGILSGYRDLETHGNAVGDSDENTKTIYSHDKQLKTDPSQLNPLEREMFNFGDAKIDNFRFSNNRIEIKHHDNELLAYCATSSFDLNTMKRMSEENIKAGNDAYDACVEITNHVEFVRVLSAYLLREHGFKYKGHGDCFYRERLVHWLHAHNTSAWNIKGREYFYQKECRIVFVPPTEFDDNSLIVNVPEITQYCRLYSANTAE